MADEAQPGDSGGGSEGRPPRKRGRGRGGAGGPGGGSGGGAGGSGGNPGGPRRGGGGSGGGGSGGGGSAGGRGPRPGGGGTAGGRPGSHSGPPPIEVAAKSTRNAIRRHGETIRDEQSQLAIRAVLIGLTSSMRQSASPAETLAMLEQVGHVLESGRRDDDQLPLALRAAVLFGLENPRRIRDVAEMVRVVLRHAYVLSADHIPRQLRDDGGFRSQAIVTVLEEVAREYLDDAAFAKLSAR